MKIQCDVCNKEEASVFCTADEAAVCHACDHHVHHANKLASKHHRFSLHHPSSKQYPLCDICLEKRAFVFCQQDRAILCKDCDFSIHSANEHAQKHNRFLLTGVMLSPSAKLYSSTAATTLSASSSISNSKSNSSVNKDSVFSSSSSNLSHPTPPLVAKTTPSVEGVDSTITSSISEYLLETLPGWQVEDFLVSSSVSSGFSKSDDMIQLFDADIEGTFGSFSPKSMGIWVPQAPPPLYTSQMDRQIENRETKEAMTNTKGSSRSRLRDDNFIVPQISRDSNSKRPRFLW